MAVNATIALILQNVSHTRIWASERQSGVSRDFFHLEKSQKFACRHYYHWSHKHNLSNKTGRGGGGDWLWVLGTFIYEQVKLQRGGRWLEPELNPLNAELNPICHLLVLLGDLKFMSPCIVSIFQYISNKVQRYTLYLYLKTALHVSGGTSTHHQERIQLYLQHLVFVTPVW